MQQIFTRGGIGTARFRLMISSFNTPDDAIPCRVCCAKANRVEPEIELCCGRVSDYFARMDLPALQPSTLYLVATPIGNLEDMTLRALRVLRECDVVAAEDTRHSGQLLKHFGISKPLLSYFQFNEARRSEEIIERLRRGEKVALVTDAGSPGISDPGERVVKAAIAAGLRVESVPGACALVAGLTASGLPTGEFHFIGFLPHKSGQRRNRLEALKQVPGTLVLYESPYRVEKLLGELKAVFPEREIVLARELTKKFEEFLRGTPATLLELTQKRSLKGEFVVLIKGG